MARITVPCNCLSQVIQLTVLGNCFSQLSQLFQTTSTGVSPQRASPQANKCKFSAVCHKQLSGLPGTNAAGTDWGEATAAQHTHAARTPQTRGAGMTRTPVNSLAWNWIFMVPIQILGRISKHRVDTSPLTTPHTPPHPLIHLKKKKNTEF